MATENQIEAKEKKPKKKLPIFGVLAIVLSIVGILVSLVTFVFVQLPSIAEVLYDNYISICDIIEWFGYEMSDAEYSLGWFLVSNINLVVGAIRDMALLLPIVVGFVISAASLGINIKGKSHIATALGTISIAVSVISAAIIGASIVRFITMELPRMLGNFIVPLIV